MSRFQLLNYTIKQLSSPKKWIILGNTYCSHRKLFYCAYNLFFLVCRNWTTGFSDDRVVISTIQFFLCKNISQGGGREKTVCDGLSSDCVNVTCVPIRDLEVVVVHIIYTLYECNIILLKRRYNAFNCGAEISQRNRPTDRRIYKKKKIHGKELNINYSIFIVLPVCIPAAKPRDLTCHPFCFVPNK